MDFLALLQSQLGVFFVNLLEVDIFMNKHLAISLKDNVSVEPYVEEVSLLII